MTKKEDQSKLIIQIIKKKIKKITIGKNKNLIENNLLDSLGLAELIFELEEKLKIKFKEKDLNIKNFKNINNILKLINKKK